MLKMIFRRHYFLLYNIYIKLAIILLFFDLTILSRRYRIETPRYGTVRNLL